MKSKITIGIFIAFLALGLLAFRKKDPMQGFQQFRQVVSKEFYESSKRLKAVSDQFSNGNSNIEDLKSALQNTRNSYKKVEFILDYYFPSFVEEHINGAPLLHVERYGTRPIVKVPEGLQVLDELIYSDEANKEKSQIAILAATLQNNVYKVLNGLVQQPINKVDIIEACRVELLRVYTLGLTGFDTPGSLNGLEESKFALESMESVVNLLFDKEKQNVGLILSLIEKGINQLDEGNFDSFDRLIFLKEVINPLYKQLQLLKGNMEVHSTKPMARNTSSTNIFGEDFLNPYYFTELSKEEDRSQLKALGELLFFDPILSSNGQMSCATCHKPSKGFADGLVKSKSSLLGKTVQRNAPTLLNSVYADRYFYDLRAYSLEQQTEHVIFNSSEFNTAYSEIVVKLGASEKYKSEFKEVFGRSGINQENFKKALASYVLSLQSFNSTFDKFVRNEIKELDPLIKDGYNLFMGKAACGTCHFAPTFSGLVPPLYQKNESEILGVLQSPNGSILDNDSGRIANKIYSESAWIYERSFKTSTVRNIEKTAPYFHNGAYNTLEEVVEFYNHGGGAGVGIEVVNQTLSSDSLHLTKGEMKAIIEFMKSLTEEE